MKHGLGKCLQLGQTYSVFSEDDRGTVKDCAAEIKSIHKRKPRGKVRNKNKANKHGADAIQHSSDSSDSECGGDGG